MQLARSAGSASFLRRRPAALAAAALLAGGVVAGAQAPEPARGLHPNYGRLPLHFEKNTGQVEARTDFLARGQGYSLFLTPRGAVLGLRSGNGEKSAVLRLNLAGGNAQARVRALDQLPGRINYFIGNDAAKWLTNIPTFGRVEYDEVYPGIDLAYYGNQGQLEFDFVVAPGADPRQIAMSFEGTRTLQLDSNGDLVLRADAGEIRQHKPVVYQDVDGTRRPVAGRYVVTGARRVAFDIGTYDKRFPLVIDPILVYSTYLGGASADVGRAIAVDAAGSAYVTGVTSMTPSPFTTPGAYQPGFGGGTNDAFVSKLTPDGSALVYSTYLGGGGNDEGRGIGVDAVGNVYVTGLAAAGFPAPAGFDTSYNGGTADAFVSKLDPTGSALLYTNFLGGGAADEGRAVAVDRELRVDRS